MTDIPNALLGRAYAPTFYAMLIILGLTAGAVILFGPFWVVASFGISIVIGFIAFCFWLAYGPPNGM